MTQIPSPKEVTMKFEVKFYSGYKGDEIPRSVIMGEREFKIEEIIERKRVLDQVSGKRYEVFICKMEGEMVKLERYESGKWGISFLEKT
jgi:hypothetical protein